MHEEINQNFEWDLIEYKIFLAAKILNVVLFLQGDGAAPRAPIRHNSNLRLDSGKVETTTTMKVKKTSLSLCRLMKHQLIY